MSQGRIVKATLQCFLFCCLISISHIHSVCTINMGNFSTFGGDRKEGLKERRMEGRTEGGRKEGLKVAGKED